MSTQKTKIDFIIGAVDKFTAPLRAINAAFGQFNANVRTFQGAFANIGAEGSRFINTSGLSRMASATGAMRGHIGGLTDAFTTLAATGTASAAGLGYAFKTQFVDTASQFERFQTILTTLNQGDAAKASQEMDWISDFAAKTPYELAEVTDSFVKLRSYGLDPTKGLLRTLGDTASAMGKPLEQAVEAMADAVTGENERLKEFGIVGSKVGEKIVYSYTNAMGKQSKLMADANDRAAIQATLTQIWSEKYGGGMEAQSKTFGGMMSNLMDWWSRFTNMVMSNGVFDWMKNKLSGVLAQIDTMSKDGRLQAWAKDIGEKLTRFFDAAWNVLPRIWSGIQAFGEKLAWVADLVGGWENLSLLFAASFSGMLAPLAGLAAAFLQLGLVILATPFGWVVGGIALVVGGIVALWAKWDSIIAWLKDAVPDWMKGDNTDSEGAPVDMKKGASRSPESLFTGGLEESMSARPQIVDASLSSSLQEMRSSHTERQESTVKVEVVAPAGTRVSQHGARIDVDTAYLGLSASGA